MPYPVNVRACRIVAQYEIFLRHDLKHFQNCGIAARPGFVHSQMNFSYGPRPFPPKSRENFEFQFRGRDGF
jgi:hypothetical protein